MLQDVLHVPELSRRASWSYHRLFSLTQARRQGHCVVLDDPLDHLRLHVSHGGGVVVPLEREHFVGVVACAGCFVESYRFGRHCAIAKNGCGIPDSVTLASRNWTGSWPLMWRVWRFLRRRSWASVRHVLCVSRTSVVSRVSRLTGMLMYLMSKARTSAVL
jgi:hypothetical protein